MAKITGLDTSSKVSCVVLGVVSDKILRFVFGVVEVVLGVVLG